MFRRRDLLNNLTIKHCDKIEKFETIFLVKSFKYRMMAFQYFLFNVIIKSRMNEIRRTINVKRIPKRHK